MTFDHEKFADFIRTEMMRRDLTWQDITNYLAACGIFSAAEIIRYGPERVPVGMFLSLCNIFEVSYNDFLVGSTPMKDVVPLEFPMFKLLVRLARLNNRDFNDSFGKDEHPTYTELIKLVKGVYGTDVQHIVIESQNIKT
jgi:hypothetical protein